VTGSRLKRGLRTIVLGLALNALLAVGKLTAGILGHSNALVADAIESFADIFTSLVVWRGLVVAAAPADAEHPYGHGKAESIAAVMVSMMLIAAAGAIIVEAFRDILRPQEGPAPFTLLVLLVVVALKEGLFRFFSREAGALGSMAIHADAWHHRSDAITSTAAAIGISIALVGGPQFAAADDAAAILAGFFIAWNGTRVLRPAFDELMDRRPSSEVIEEIETLAASIPEVQRVEKCVVRKTGNDYLVDMHVEVDPQMTVQRAHEVAHAVKDRVRAGMPAVQDVLVHVEPHRGANR
jgi:cation diffusion facilitator family transporter